MPNIRINDRASQNHYIKTEYEGDPDDPYVIQVGIDGVGTTDGALDVSVQDATTDTLILPAVNQLGSTVTVGAVVPDAITFIVADSTGMVIGDHIRIINTTGDRYYNGTILDITGNIIEADNIMDFAYASGSEVTWGNINMAVDGSATPVHFHLRTGSPSIPSAIDITRMIMVCECVGAVDLNKFGDISGGLERGLMFRENNGFLRNIWNIKTNSDLASLAYDWTPYDASHPTQGVNGFAWRLTFGSAGKLGVVIRIESNGQLGLIVQDDLSGLISLTCMFEGHVVDEN